MARRVTWTNNSTAYDGTNIYRDTTIDPQNLPEPIATVDPVSQGATVEYIDLTGSGDQCYAVRDFDSSGDGALSEAYCYEKISPFDDAQIGDEIEGGIYAGEIEYGDGRRFHIIAAKASGEASYQWGYYGTETGANDAYDGEYNQQVIAGLGYGSGNAEGFEHCANYSGGGFSDWYMPAYYELDMISKNLSGHAEFSDNTASFDWTWCSTEDTDDPDIVPSAEALPDLAAIRIRLSSDSTGRTDKDNIHRVRPVRRVPV